MNAFVDTIGSEGTPTHRFLSLLIHNALNETMGISKTDIRM